MIQRRLFTAIFLMAALAAGAQTSIDLSGLWRVLTDGADEQEVMLPGTLDDAGLGTPNTLAPQLSKPQLSRLTRKHSFIGEARYERSVTIPASMAGLPLRLSLERVLWKSRLLVDGLELSPSQESLVAPHVFTLADGLSAGTHRLTLIVDNRRQHDISFDNLAHSYTNDTQIMWNGVLGSMTLSLVPAISDVQVYPDVSRQQVRISVEATATELDFLLDGQPVSPKALGDGCYMLPMPEGQLWSEFSPHLYTLTVRPRNRGASLVPDPTSLAIDAFSVTFGMRSFQADGNRLLVNGVPVFLRGTLECCIFPLTGTPPTDEAGWQKVFTTARAYGLNHLRFHSWCPPDAAFRVADKLGFYLQVELPHWSLNVGKDSLTTRFLRDEARRILRFYGNHPSFCILSCGNELQPDFQLLNALTHDLRQSDPRHLYTTSTFTFEKGHGRHPEPEDDVFITQWTDHGWVRGQGIFDEQEPDFSSDYREATADIAVPLISHEIGQYSVYPNIAEISKYTGVLDPLNLKAIRNDLQAKGLLHKAADYLQASGQLAAILYKEEIERAMKTPGQSGFQLLDLHDFPGQGTALVGLLDAFWDSKGIITPERFREFCAPVVPLARFSKAVWQNNETFEASFEVSGDNTRPLAWQLVDDTGRCLAQGEGMQAVVPLGDIREASHLQLIASIPNTLWRNSWSIWVYPHILTDMTVDQHRLKKQKTVVTASADDALRALRRGKRVLFAPDPTSVKGVEGKFVPVFWSPVHFPKQAGTMGLLCNEHHPALAHFPNAGHSDWQWWRLVKGSRAMVLDSLPPVAPIVETIDNFVSNRRLAQLFEARVGKGRLLMSSFPLLTSDAPEVRQLLYSLLRYMESPAFAPTTPITPDDVRRLLSPTEEALPATTATDIYQ